MSERRYRPESALAFAQRLNSRGLPYEQAGAEWLNAQGYVVEFNIDHNYLENDLTLAPDIAVEVKGSTLRKLTHGKYGYGFLLHKANRSKRIHEPVTLLDCYDQANRIHYFFIVPTPLLQNRNYLEFRDPIPHQWASPFAEYYKATHVLDALGAKKLETA